MIRYLVLTYFVMLSGISCSKLPENEISEDQQLMFAIVLNRHGERSPDSDEISLSDQQELIKNLTYIEGPEGLTNVGKRRSFQIGKYYRQRYGSEGHSLISNLYLRNEISIRSTDKERTKMTIQVAMAAVYPPDVEQQWDEGLGKVWQPVPYTAVPLSEDYLRYYSNCERFMQMMKEAKEDSLNKEFAPYLDLIPILKKQTGRNFTEDLVLFETLFDLFRSMVGLGLDIPEWSKPLLPKLSEAARLAYRLYFRTDEMKKIGGGVLLNQFIETSEAIMSGQPVTKRLRLFSCHDFNIGSLMDVAGVKNDNGLPEYGAVFSLELYKSRSTGEYSVVPVYLPQAGQSTARVLGIQGCNNTYYCNFSKFKELTKKFVLPEKDYYQLCNIKTEL